MRHSISSLYTRLPQRCIPLLLSALLVIACIIYLDRFILKNAMFAEVPPRLDAIHLLRTGALALCGWLITISITPIRSPIGELTRPKAVFDSWGGWGQITWSTDDPVERDIFSLGLSKVIVLAVLLLSSSFVMLSVFDASLFYYLVLEDNPVEMLSALFLFAGCFIFVYICYLMRKNNQDIKLFIVSLLIAFAFFIIGMEEVSWFQRQLSIETPGLFSASMQNEINLHNFHTGLSENLYYTSAFACLVFIPFIQDKIALFEPNGVISFYMPSRFIIFISAIIMAYNYDMWNIIFTQLAFFTTLFILIHYACLYRRVDKKEKTMPVIIFVYVLTQLIFLIFGDRFIRLWDVTEYKEFFIPLSCMIYSLEMLNKAKNIKKAL